ncbi:Clp protease ClpP [uncultured Alistipes sp.]|uniref:Clp protease ClpP n=1 Tax=uncultured Alistipes sp. TaxID=538949 RepID=UPI002622C442|nr:Clp protease ClpP [uncultured Alistipes sp.]
MKSNIRIRNEADRCCIDIEGTIGVPEAWQFESADDRVATYEKFRETVARIAALEARHIVVNIRSTGGDVNDALLIYEALAALDAHVTTRCYGYTASAATIIAQAADEGCREISAEALYLIHTASCAAEGNATALETRAELLRKTDERLAALYARRSGHAPEEFLSLMAQNNGEGRWLSPAETLEAGLADRIIEADGRTAPVNEEEKSIVRNLIHGWNRLLASLGVEERDGASSATPANVTAPQRTRHDLLHFDGIEFESQSSQAVTAAIEGQQRTAATQVLPCEDPSVNEIRRSANDRAYADDARRLTAK